MRDIHTIYLAAGHYDLSTYRPSELRVTRSLSLIAPYGTAVLDAMHRPPPRSQGPKYCDLLGFEVCSDTSSLVRRVLNINSNEATVYLEGLNITGGYIGLGAGVLKGAGIFNKGKLTMVRCNVKENSGRRVSRVVRIIYRSEVFVFTPTHEDGSL